MTERQLLETIQQGATVLTANRRLAAFFQQKYADFQLQHGKSVWISPAIYSFQDYLLNSWNNFVATQLSNTKTLLTPFQSYVIWQNIIQKTTINHTAPDDLLNLDATTNSAIKAWELLQSWNLSLDTLPVPTKIDEHAFQLWAKQFQDYLATKHYLDQTMLCNEVGYLIKKNQINPPAHLIFSGFDTFTPQQKSLIALLEQQNCILDFFDFSVTPEVIGQFSCPDEKQELESAAQYCQQQLQKGCHSIAVVVPDLQQKRNEIERIFRATVSHFNISAGKALSDYPVIDVALTLLAWNQKPIALNTLSYLVRSPFILASEVESIARQKLDFALKQNAQFDIPLKKILELSEKNSCLQFLELLKQISLKHSHPKSCNEWSDIFLEKLKQCGWPGERLVDSEEFQAIERFKKLLNDEFRQLNLVTSKVSFTTALSLLKQLCRQTVFQAQKPEPAAIQILGLLEASGMTYDAMWITGLTERQLPTVPSLNPFLSAELQRQLQMPHSSVEREYQFSKKLIDRLSLSAHKIVLSFARCIDNENIHASPLIETIEALPQDIFEVKTTSETTVDQVFLEDIAEQNVPFDFTLEKLRGGSQVIKEQSLCSFRAFSFFRLHCKTLMMPQFSLSAPVRGNIIHKILELVWKKLESKEQLKNNFSEDPDSLFIGFLSKEIEQVLRFYDLSNSLFEIEKQHLLDLLMQYFKTELQRDDFVVDAVEKNIEIQLKNFTLNLRIDRFDKLLNNQIAIIDYKTSDCKISEWFGTRPTAPQLPLYAAFYDPAPSQLLFAQLKRGHCEFIGVSHDETDHKNIKTLEKTKLTESSWSQQIQEWKIVCEQLIEDFKQGEIKLNPHPVKKPCNTCDLKMLCRIYETNQL